MVLDFGGRSTRSSSGLDGVHAHTLPRAQPHHIPGGLIGGGQNLPAGLLAGGQPNPLMYLSNQKISPGVLGNRLHTPVLLTMLHSYTIYKNIFTVHLISTAGPNLKKIKHLMLCSWSRIV